MLSLNRIDRRKISSKHELRAFLVVRNESLRLPATLRHCRQLGIDRFFIVDNGSTDGTLDLLGAERDVHLFSTTDSYAESGYGLAWLNDMLDEYGAGGWVLTVDADELLVYPHSEQVNLRRFCDYLDRRAMQAVFCVLIDMYGEGAIGSVQYRPGESLVDACPYFDSTGYRAIKVNQPPFIQIYGGPRERAFWHPKDRGYHPPAVSKAPLIKWQKGFRYTVGTHGFWPPLLMSDVQAAFLHFKFLGDFPARAKVEAERGEHFDQAREYKAYADLLEGDRTIVLKNHKSTRYRSSQQLLSLGLMRTSGEYENYCRSIIGR
jgi:Glycosyl transferase family 2